MTVSLLVPALARPLPVLQSGARQSESILGRLCNPARVDTTAYPAVALPCRLLSLLQNLAYRPPQAPAGKASRDIIIIEDSFNPFHKIVALWLFK